MTPTDWYRRLEWIPVRHACQHFELRLTRWTYQADRDIGYLVAGSVCSTCDAQGRPVVAQYLTLEAAQAAVTPR